MMKKGNIPYKFHHQRRGFTLIELLIVVAILVTVLGIGLSSFSGFNRRERLKQTALTFKSQLRFAQTKAISAAKPSSGCTVYEGMRVSFSASTYQTEHVCSPEGVILTADCTPGATQDCIILPSDITFSPVPPTFSFHTLSNRTSLTANATITFTNGNQNYIIIVSPNGSVSDQGIQ